MRNNRGSIPLSGQINYEVETNGRRFWAAGEFGRQVCDRKFYPFHQIHRWVASQ